MSATMRAFSAGTMTIELYPGEQLGIERQCLELPQIGSLAMTKVSASLMANFAPANQVLGLS
jgi:TRAP-type C4-dicarboxylate transport system substrate-binding protein